MQQKIGDLLVSRGPRLERRQQASYLTNTTTQAREHAQLMKTMTWHQLMIGIVMKCPTWNIYVLCSRNQVICEKSQKYIPYLLELGSLLELRRLLELEPSQKWFVRIRAHTRIRAHKRLNFGDMWDTPLRVRKSRQSYRNWGWKYRSSHFGRWR